MFDSKIIVEEAPTAPQQVSRPLQSTRMPDFPPSIPQPPAQPIPPKGKKGKLALIIASVVLGVILFGGGGVFAAYYLGYLDIPYLNKYFTREEVLLAAIDSVSEVKSAKYTMQLAIAVEPKAKDSELLYEDTQGASAKEKARAAELKSNVAQVRTALNLFYDDYTEYAVELKQLTSSNNYLFDKSVTDDLVYKPSQDRKGYTLSAFMDIDGNKKEYAMNDLGAITVDTFPSTSNNESSAQEFISGLADYLSPDFTVEGTMTAFASTEGDPKGEWTLAGSYKSSGTKYELAAEAKLIKDTLFFQATKIPTFPIPGVNLSALTNKWIRVTEEDINSLDEQYGVPVDVSAYDQFDTSDVKRTYVSFLKSAISSKYLTVRRKFPSEKIDGQKYEHYRLMLDENRLKDFLKSFLSAEETYCASHSCLFNYLNSLSGDDKFEFDEKEFDDGFQETYDEMKESQMIRLMHDLTDIDIFLQKGKKAYRLRTTTRFAFPDDEEKMKGKQFRLTTELLIDHIGEQPNVESPKDFIKPEDLEKLLLGYSDAEWKFKQQIDTITKVRNALKSYQSAHDGKYPEKLSDLVEAKTTEEDDAINPLSFFNKNRQFAQVTIDEAPLQLDTVDISPFYRTTLTEEPKDIFTGKPFGYASDSKTYTLQYQMELPSAEDLDDEKIPSYQVEQFVNGQNTADKYVYSRELEAKKDSDDDGLTGTQEVANGTDPTKKDTDGDLASDFDEVQAKSDPLDPVSSPTPQKPTLSSKSGSVAGGSVATVTYITRSKTITVYFGDRRAYVFPASSISIDYYGFGGTTSDLNKSFRVVIPTYPGDIAQGQTKEVSVKLVDGTNEFVIGNFIYNGGQKKDTDSDGLADNEEFSIGTSASKEDSDSDGYSDFVEVTAGYDPKNAPAR